jgi:hypothetical protein
VDDEVTELAALRRRAYGPDADIDADPQALLRLQALENRARHASAAVDAPSVEEPPDAIAALPERAAPPAVTEAGSPGRRLGWRAVVVAGIAVVAVLVAGQVMGPQTVDPVADASPAASPGAPLVDRAGTGSEATLVDIPLDRSLARYVEQPAAPQFPVDGGLRWAESLGAYYGWTVWLARSASGQRCILLDRSDRTFTRCAEEEGFLVGLLEESVPFADLAPDYRPARMTDRDSLVFRWTPERGLSILLTDAELTASGGDE